MFIGGSFMKKAIRIVTLIFLGVALITSSLSLMANAASRNRVLSTTKVAKKAYHSKSGNVYSTNKLTHRKYQMKNYKYTTWYSYKKSVIKIKGKKRSYIYIKAGKKAGWIYSKSLVSGKAKPKKVSRLTADYLAFQKARKLASPTTRIFLGDCLFREYYSMGNVLLSAYGDVRSLNDARADKKSVMRMYLIFRKYFSTSTQLQLDKAYKLLKATNSDRANLNSRVLMFSWMVGSQVYQMTNNVSKKNKRMMLMGLQFDNGALYASSANRVDLISNTDIYGYPNYKSKADNMSSGYLEMPHSIAGSKGDKKSLLLIYDLFKNKLTNKARVSFDKRMAKLRKTPVNQKTNKHVHSMVESLGHSLSDQVKTFK